MLGVVSLKPTAKPKTPPILFFLNACQNSDRSTHICLPRCSLISSTPTPADAFCRCCPAPALTTLWHWNASNALADIPCGERTGRSTRERVRSIGKDGNNGSQGQTTRHEQMAGITPRPECPPPRRVERIPARTQRAVGGGGRTPAAERAGRRPAPGTPSGRPHQGGLRLRVPGRCQQGEVIGDVCTRH